MLAIGACSSPGHSSGMLVDAGTPDAPPAGSGVEITAVVDSKQFVVREHMLAAGEMQISGEPLAQTMGRDLTGYSRDLLPPNLYNDPVLGVAWIDLAGFSTGVESYEYSKQPMNFLAFESGAGTALVHAPLVAGISNLVDMMQHFAEGADTLDKWVFPAGTWPSMNPYGDTNPTGAGSGAANPLGWPGMWPTVHLFDSFDPTINPTSDIVLRCSISSDDTPQSAGSGSPARELCADYECDASTLHLANRTMQIARSGSAGPRSAPEGERGAVIDGHITPGADGFATWKYGLWTLNYLQIMHDSTEAAVASVPAADLSGVGSAGNTIIGDDSTGTPTAPGTFLGSSDIEGFQAQMFILEVEARADDWLTSLTTGDGATLSGFTSIGAAESYGYASPLRWFPGSIAVAETDDPSTGFPIPAYSLASADSHALDLIGLAMGYSEFFALTDQANPDVGGSQPALAYFDGDPFPADNQLPDGEATLHDRALAMIRVAIVNLDRLHVDPASNIIVDDVTFSGTTPTRGTTVSTTTVAYALLGLRTVLRSCGSELELYSNNTPDTMTAGALDSLPISFPSDATLTFSARARQLVLAHAELLYNSLTDATGRAYDGWDLAANAPLDQSDVLDAHTAAVRGLFAAYLATGDTKYRTRAIAVYDRLEATFYQADARIYTETASAPSVQYTPLRFALLQSTLRDMYELVAALPGGESRELTLEGRLARLDKLVLNGWDDRNDDQQVYEPECVQYDGVDIPRGGLQMAERTLTGELGRAGDEGATGPETVDRDTDCVPEIDDAHVPAGLADAITFTIHRN
ncbi:MAG TPA: hypothetical protein VGG74_16780 [Kofleriaceae bacterium]